jgi:hypothetical protein
VRCRCWVIGLSLLEEVLIPTYLEEQSYPRTMSSSPDGPVVKPVLAQLDDSRVTSANKALGRRHGPNADVGSMQA